MRKKIQDFFGITNMVFHQVKRFTELQNEIKELEKRIETHIEEQKLSTQRTQKALQSMERQLEAFGTAMAQRLPLLEENDIEKDTGGDEITVTDDMHIPIVSGMKVRFETEGVETDIHIE